MNQIYRERTEDQGTTAYFFASIFLQLGAEGNDLFLFAGSTGSAEGIEAEQLTVDRGFLVGGFSPTPLKNMLVKMGSSSPIFGVKIPKIFELPPGKPSVPFF